MISVGAEPCFSGNGMPDSNHAAECRGKSRVIAQGEHWGRMSGDAGHGLPHSLKDGWLKDGCAHAGIADLVVAMASR